MLVCDANVILSAALGMRWRAGFTAVARRRLLVTSERGRDEVLGVAGDPVRVPAGSMEAAQYAALMEDATGALRDAVPSGDAGVRDAHMLALAWAVLAGARG